MRFQIGPLCAVGETGSLAILFWENVATEGHVNARVTFLYQFTDMSGIALFLREALATHFTKIKLTEPTSYEKYPDLTNLVFTLTLGDWLRSAPSLLRATKRKLQAAIALAEELARQADQEDRETYSKTWEQEAS